MLGNWLLRSLVFGRGAKSKDFGVPEWLAAANPGDTSLAGSERGGSHRRQVCRAWVGGPGCLDA